VNVYRYDIVHTIFNRTTVFIWVLKNITLYEKCNAILSTKREDNSFYLSTEKYNKCVEDVLKFKGKESN